MANTGLQPVVLAITVVSPCIALIFVAIRLYTKYFLLKGLGWDDALISAAMILAIAMAYVTAEGTIANYLGWHYADVPWDEYDPIQAAKWNYATQILYNPILALVKNAVLLLFLRLGGTKRKLRRFITGLMIVNTTMMFAILLTDILQCIPIAKTFDASIPGQCISIGNFFIATASLTTVTDILVMIIPTWVTMGLQLKTSKKLAVILLLSLGIVVTAVGVYRLYFLINAYYGPVNPDSTYGVGGTASSIEVNLAIATACGASLKPAIQHWFPTFFGGSEATTPRRATGGSQYVRFGENGTTVHSAKIQGGHGGDYELRSTAARAKGGAAVHGLDNISDDDDNSEKDMVVAASSGIVKKMDVSVKYSSMDDARTPQSSRRGSDSHLAAARGGDGYSGFAAKPSGPRATPESIV